MKYLLNGEETERLRFRLLQNEDFEAWVPLFRHPDVARFLGLDPGLTERELCQLWFDKVYNRYEKDTGGMNVLIDKQSNRLVGQCGLLVQTVEEKKRLEVGYSMLPEFWNMGYASEAAQKCRDFAFTNDFTDSLISIVHVDNIGSASVARKNGMEVELLIPDFDGSPVNIFAVQKQDWLTRR